MTDSNFATVSDDSIVKVYNGFFQEIPKGWDTFTESTKDFFATLVENIAENNECLTDLYQGLLVRSYMVYDIRTLMSSAPLQIQQGLHPSRVLKIWMDKESGLVATGTLLSLPTVGILSNGELVLLAGNHRIAALAVPLLNAGAETDHVLSQNLQVEQVSVDMDALAKRTGLKPGEELAKFADKLLWSLWLASNQTRSVSAAEIKDASVFRTGINPLDREQLIEAVYTSPKKLTMTQALRFTACQALYDDGTYPASIMPCTFEGDTWNNGVDYSISLTTLDSLATRFISVLRGFSETVSRGASVVNVKLYSKDIQNPELFEQLSEYFYTNLGYCINEVMNRKAVDGTTDSNVARSTSAIGQFMAESYATDYQPDNDPRIERGKPSNRSGKVVKTALGLTGLNLAL